jgi:hypothetical protein
VPPLFSCAGNWSRRVHRRKAALAALELVATRRELRASVKRISLGMLRLHAASVEALLKAKELQRGG